MRTEPLNNFPDDFFPMTAEEIAVVEQQLRRLPLPCNRLNKAHLLFEAGRLSARQELPRSSGRGWFWPATSLLGLSVSVVLAVLYLGERQKHLPGNPAVFPAAVAARSTVSGRVPGPVPAAGTHTAGPAVVKKSVRQPAQKQPAQKPSVRQRGPTAFPRTVTAVQLWRLRYPILATRVKDLPMRPAGAGSFIEPAKTWQQYRLSLLSEGRILSDRQDTGRRVERRTPRQSAPSHPSAFSLFPWTWSFLQRGSL